jgi:hypothetical protein
MTEFDLIARIRPQEPLPDENELAPARSRLMRTLASEPGASAAPVSPPLSQPARPGRRFAAPRRRRGIVLGAALAAGTAVACVVALAVNAGSGGGHATAGHGARPAVTRQAKTWHEVIGGRFVRIPATLTAAQFLTEASAATRRERTPVPAPDQYIYSEQYANSPGQGTSREWLSVDGSRPGVLELSNGMRLRVDVCTAAQASSTGCNPSVGYLPGLPVRANAVLPYLVRLQLAATTTNPQNTPNWLANNNGKAVEALLQTTYLVPAQRAAMFQMLAQTPGFEIVRNAADAVGRRGVGIYWLYQGAGAMMVFDPATYQFLGFGTWPEGAVPANGQIPPASHGVVSAPNAGAIVAMAIVNSEPPVPPEPKARPETANQRLAGLFGLARSWASRRPGHEQLTVGQVVVDYLRDVRHLSPARVQQVMRKLAGLSPWLPKLLCVPDNTRDFVRIRQRGAPSWPCKAG